MAPAIASLAPKKMSATRKIRSHLLLAVLCNYSCVFYKVFILIKKERVPHSQREQRLRRDFEAQTRKICTEAKPPHVPEVYLTVTREILRVSARKIPQARASMAHALGER